MRDEVGKPIVQGVAQGIEKNTDVATGALEKMGDEMLESEKLYLAEKERLEKEAAEKELAERLANAKNAKEVEKIKQEEINKAAQAAQDAYLEGLKAKAEAERKEYDAIVEAEKQAFEELKKSYEDVVNQLYSDVNDTFSTNTFDYGDHVEEYYTLPNMKKQNENLRTYNTLLDELIAKYGTLPEEVIENLAEMTTEDGIKYVTAMLNASEEVWNEYVTSFAERQNIAEKIGQALFPDAALENIKTTVEGLSGSLFGALETDFDATAVNLAESLTTVKGVVGEIAQEVASMKSGGGVVVNQTNNFQQAYTSRKEQYKSKIQLGATVRLAAVGAL